MELAGGYQARPARPEDVDVVADLTAAVDIGQGSAPSYRRDDILVDWNRAGFDLATDSWLVESEGAPVAFGHLAPRGNTDLVFMLWIHPEHEGSPLGHALVPLMEGRAKEIAAASTHRRGVAIAAEEESTLRRAILEHGFEPDALFVEMVGDLPAPPPEAPSPTGIEIRGYRKEEAERFYEVLVSAFDQHWGAGFPPFEEWFREVTTPAGYDPSLSLVALDGSDIVGVLMASLHEGWGEIHDIGVLEEHRGRGIGAALMHEIFRLFHEKSGVRARLWVDTDNVTEAIRLYRRVGMSVSRRMHFYAKDLTA